MKLKDFLQKKTEVVGLDIGEASIQVAYKEKTASIPTPAGLVKDGIILNPAKAAQAVRKLLFKEKIKSRSIAVVIHGNDLLLHGTTISYAKDQVIEEQLKKKVNQYVAYAGKETIVAWQKIDDDYSSGERKLKVLVAVANRDLVESYTRTAILAGLKIAAMYLPSVASFNSLKDGSLKTTSKDQKLFVHIDGEHSYVQVVSGGKIVFAHVCAVAHVEDDVQKVFASYPNAAGLSIHVDDEKTKAALAGLGEKIGKPVQFEAGQVAAGAAKAKPSEMNLLPKDVRQVQEWRAQFTYLLFAALGTTFFMLALFFAVYFWSIMLDGRIKQVEKELDQPRLEFAKLKEIEEKTKEIRALINGRLLLKDKRTVFLWDDILGQIGSSVPQGLALIHVDNRDKEILLEGETLNSDTVFVFLNQLKKSELFKMVELRRVRRGELEGDLTTFGIRLDLK